MIMQRAMDTSSISWHTVCMYVCMFEHVPLRFEDDPVVDGLVSRALSVVDEKYGVEGINPKGYHNPQHTADVVHAASELSDLAITHGKITPADKRLIIIAAAYHDTEQDTGSGNNEEESAALTIAHMREAGGFTEEDERTVRDIIMATVVSFDEAGKMRQGAIEADYRTQIMADADLASLGKPPEVYWDRAQGLFTEWNPGYDLNTEQGRKFISSQVTFISNHQYYTPEAAQLFPYLEANIAFTQELITSNDA